MQIGQPSYEYLQTAFWPNLVGATLDSICRAHAYHAHHVKDCAQ